MLDFEAMKVVERIRRGRLHGTLWLGLVLGFVGEELSAHEWHRHHDAAGTPVSNPVFHIPEDEGGEPENSAVIAERAEAFSAFHPRVRIRWDEQWLYVESDGIADHEMMTGITNWQQQIPVPQYYYGNNAWQFPLNPQPATSATPISSENLLRGAYAIAVNGIPIFNLYNNRGENTAEIGELDQWGGHCGRADDYHYHLVPPQLAATVGESAPLAYALDGYPIYGRLEPDGTEQTAALDSNMGHSLGNHGYHYHALESADYSLAGLHGVVRVSGNGPENQIDPQPRTSEFRPAETPLRGASITAFSRPGDNAFSLNYELGGQSYQVHWSLDRSLGSVTYEFVSPEGNTSSATYANWLAGPNVDTPEISASYRDAGRLQFAIKGTPETSYPFSWSSDLLNWARFGFLQLDGQGEASFSLDAIGTRGFLGVAGTGRLDHSNNETDPREGEPDPIEVGLDPGKTPVMSVTQGEATTVIENLYPEGQRIAGVGMIVASDGSSWTVPADTQFQAQVFAPDLYNPQNRVAPNSIAAVDIDAVPIVEIDPDGEIITGYIFADNYFELYVNGVLVGVDPIPFTPFNSNVVRFRAKAPITYAFKLVDWEENLGLGSENNRGNAYHPGDAGLIASFSDGTVTNGDWKAQTFYIAPIDDPENLVVREDGTRDSSGANQITGSSLSYGLHWLVPDDWFSPDYDDSHWPGATTFRNETVGVDNKPSFTNFEEQFSGNGAQFIWSSNLVLDNEVIVRFTTGAPEVQESSVATFSVTSEAIKDGVLLDAFKCEMKSRVDGSEASIPLAWSGIPEGTKSIAVTMHHYPNPNESDPAKANQYLQLWGIDPSVSGIPHGAADDGPWFIGANKDNNVVSYTSPCSRGGGAGGHSYTITVYALAERPASLPSSSSLDVTYSVLLDAMKTVSVIETASITFTD